MAPPQWGAFRLALYAYIDDVEYEVQQYAASFELNAIPHCELNVAVGRDVRTLQPAAAHRHLGKIETGSQLQVYLKIEHLGHQGSVPHRWPIGQFKVFEGDVVGVSWQRGTNNASFHIHAEHWLAKLNYSSSLSGSSHPGNPADFTYASGFRPVDVAEGGGGGIRWVPHVQIEGNVTRGDLEADLWERVIKKWMIQVSEQDPIDDRLSDAVSNAAAIAALTRMRSEQMGMQFDSGIDGNALGNAVVWDMNKAISRADVNITLWAKLIGEWAVNYWFAVVPRVTDAIVVPFTGGLRGKPWVTIKTGDYVQHDKSRPMPQRLRCVGITLSTAFEAGGDTNPAAWGLPRRGLAGLYKAVRPHPEGLVLLKDAPRWLSDPVQGYRYGRVTAGIVPRVPIRMVLTPEEFGPERSPPGRPDDNQKEMRRILDQLAHQWFVIEMLKGRTGEISGRLRFDVAPGSQVKVIGGTDPFVQAAGGDELGEPFYAVVSKVTYLINAETQRAGTSFTLAHIRNTAENESDDTSIPRPPLYKAGWFGKALIDGFTPGA